MSAQVPQHRKESEDLSEWESVYLRNRDSPSVSYRQQRTSQIKHQQIWLIVHIILLLSISIISIPLLNTKANILSKFYSDSACCYCLWVGYSTVSDNHEIEWSSCTNEKTVNYQNDIYKTCYFNNTSHCGVQYSNGPAGLFKVKKYSTSSFIFFWNIHKYYPYYGILNTCLVIVYLLYLMIATFWYKHPLSFFLLIGNIIVSMNTIYTYIKLYQYAEYDYGQMCPVSDQPIQNTICYRNILSSTLELPISWISIFLGIFVTPFYFCICAKCCRSHSRKLHFILLCIFIIGGMIVLILVFIALSIVIKESDAELITFLNESEEKGFMMFIAVVLLLMSIDGLVLKHCREQMRSMLAIWCSRSTNKPSYYKLNDNIST